MFYNYLITTLRNIKRHKGYAFINILGLAVGMACCILILLWVRYELSFDRYHDNADRIVRIAIDANLGGTSIMAPVCNTVAGQALKEEFPEVEDYTRLTDRDKILVGYRDRSFYEENILLADNSIFHLFSFPLIEGDPATALIRPYTVVLTESSARKYFDKADPMGRFITFNETDRYEVTGIVADVPANSHFTFDMLTSFETLYHIREAEELNQWLNMSYSLYLLLAENTDPAQLEAKLPEFVNRHMGPTLQALGGTLVFLLQPITEIHLYSHMQYEMSPPGDIVNVYLFSAVALFILLIAAINFVNLSTARSATRAKEVSVRKTFGADRGSLARQFLGESIIHSFLAMLVAVFLLEITMPLFNELAGTHLILDYFSSPWAIPGLVGLALIVGGSAGLYPALLLSAFQPARILKGKGASTGSSSRLRAALVILQFAISVALIIGTLCMYQQMDYMKSRRLGFDKDRVVVLPEVDRATGDKAGLLADRLRQVAGIQSVTATTTIPGYPRSNSLYKPEGLTDDQALIMAVIRTDPNFIPTLKMEMAAGRNFSPDFPTDSIETVIINETAARQAGWDDPVGKILKDADLLPEGMVWIDRTVIGVVKDFHFKSLHAKIEPMVMFYDTEDMHYLCIRIAPDDIPATLGRIEAAWNDLAPNHPFAYTFLDDSFNELYQAEERLSGVMMAFGLLAVFIGCLGLFGLASFTTECRTKEIGVRKVLGASISSIVHLLTRELLLWVAIANLVAWPVAYIGLDRWLQNFAYRIDLHLLTFLLAGTVSLIVGFAAVSYQTIRAARSNPARALTHE